MKAVVTGMIATYPVGGVLWDYGQYALGLERMGFEVLYLEDTAGPTYNPDQRQYTDDPSFGVQFLAESLKSLSPSLGQQWHFRAMDDSTFGLDVEHVNHFLKDADLMLNVSGSALLRDAYMSCPHKVLIDTDPGWNHFVNYPKWDRSPGWQGTHGYRAHDHFFTYAERIGREDCELPTMGIDWKPTRPVVVTDCWKPQPPGETWTTVMTWNNFREPVIHNGRTYGTKEMEFRKIEPLPGIVDAALEVAVGGSHPPVDRWTAAGWSVVDSHDVSRTPEDYRQYVQQSRGEVSVAKNLYVAPRTGWFSCRSICYLAAGRPVVLQDTGFSEFIPTGQGLFAFSDLEQAADAIRCVEAQYETHRTAARRLAESHFAAPVVLGRMLESIGLG